jgi:hypothetical protein
MTTTTRTETDPTMPGVNGDDVPDTGAAALEAAGFDAESLRDVLEEGRKFLRERPAAALGGAFAIGLIFGRLWKIRVLRIAVPLAAFAAGYAAEKIVDQSDGPVLAT